MIYITQFKVKLGVLSRIERSLTHVSYSLYLHTYFFKHVNSIINYITRKQVQPDGFFVNCKNINHKIPFIV